MLHCFISENWDKPPKTKYDLPPNNHTEDNAVNVQDMYMFMYYPKSSSIFMSDFLYTIILWLSLSGKCLHEG